MRCCAMRCCAMRCCAMRVTLGKARLLGDALTDSLFELMVWIMLYCWVASTCECSSMEWKCLWSRMQSTCFYIRSQAGAMSFAWEAARYFCWSGAGSIPLCQLRSSQRAFVWTGWSQAVSNRSRLVMSPFVQLFYVVVFGTYIQHESTSNFAHIAVYRYFCSHTSLHTLVFGTPMLRGSDRSWLRSLLSASLVKQHVVIELSKVSKRLLSQVCYHHHLLNKYFKELSLSSVLLMIVCRSRGRKWRVDQQVFPCYIGASRIANRRVGISLNSPLWCSFWILWSKKNTLTCVNCVIIQSGDFLIILIIEFLITYFSKPKRWCKLSVEVWISMRLIFTVNRNGTLNANECKIAGWVIKHDLVWIKEIVNNSMINKGHPCLLRVGQFI